MAIRVSELHAKLLDEMSRQRNKSVMDGLNPCSPGIDVTYEFGRRVGAKQGMDLMIQTLVNFFQAEESNDEKL
jgi:hypothetical protein